MAAIETNGLTKIFGDSVVAVDDLDLEVHEGEVYGFLGPNGAGKSTTINLLLDFIHPTSGEARVLGRDTREESTAIRERIGILPEGATPYARLNAYEHLEFAMEMKGVDGDSDELLSHVGLDAADAERKVGTYSKGMMQRLGLGMALVGDPDLLILDEPSSGLDPTGMGEMRELIREEANDGTAVFFSSHILPEVEAVCDRVGILNQGELVAQDSIESLRDRFAGECTVELQVDATPESGFGLADVEGVVDATVEGDAITVTCENKTVRADVIQRVGERATVIDVISEETSLESMFEQYTDETSENSETSNDGGDAVLSEARS